MYFESMEGSQVTGRCVFSVSQNLSDEQIKYLIKIVIGNMVCVDVLPYE